MMKITEYPDRDSLKLLLKRPVIDSRSIQQTVKTIVDEVKQNGDSALKKFTRQFDGTDLVNIKVTPEEITLAADAVSDELKKAIKTAAANIRKFHEANTNSSTKVIETMDGIECWYSSVAIEKVGLYIPGGTAPLFSTLLMLGIPATIAACKEIVICTPADKSGNINEIILYTASLLGLTSIYKVGGAQAIAAMAYGTASIPQVYKIFGPGNQYVTTAKQLVQSEGVAIDMPAGPSEVCIIADDTAEPSFIAADLLSQAEHGKDSQVLFITTSKSLANDVQKQLQSQLDALPRKDIAAATLQNSHCIVVESIETAISISNEYAPEHLIIACENENEIANQITNAGSVFLGNYSPESAGDYASGTNHTLPTNGYAKAYSGVSVESFMKKISYQRISPTGLASLSSTIIEMAEAEGLQAHANAVKIRMDK